MVAIEESTAAAAAGVSFSLTEEQKELCRLAHTFAEREIRPRQAAHDAEQRHPVELIAHAHELGLMNLHVPAEYGGLVGSPEQRAHWLPPLAEQPILCSFALTEPGAGSDVAALRSTAVRDGDEYVLNGSKTFITNAGHAAWAVVFAKTDPVAGRRGMSAFVVELGPRGAT